MPNPLKKMFALFAKPEENVGKDSVPECGPWFLLRDHPHTSMGCSWSIFEERRETAEFAVACAALSGFLPTREELDAIALAIMEHDSVPQRSSGLCSCLYVLARRFPSSIGADAGGKEWAERLNGVAAGLARVHAGRLYDGDGNDVLVGSGHILSKDGTMYRLPEIPEGVDSAFGGFDEVPPAFDIKGRPETARALKDFHIVAGLVRPDNLGFRAAMLLGALWARIPNPDDVWRPWRSMALRLFSRAVFDGTGVLPKWQILAQSRNLVKRFHEIGSRRLRAPAGPDGFWNADSTRLDCPEEEWIFETILEPSKE